MLWQPCDSACRAQTRFWLWLCHPSPGSRSTPVRDQEWRRVELINVTVLGRTDKGFSDSRSVFYALIETLIYYKKKNGERAEVGGWVCLTERVCDPGQAKRPLSQFCFCLRVWRSCCHWHPLRGPVWLPWGTSLPLWGGQSRSHEVMSSPFERTVWVPWGGSPIPDEPHHYGQSPPLEGDVFCMPHRGLVALPVGSLSLRCLPVSQPRIQGHCGRMILEAES